MTPEERGARIKRQAWLKAQGRGGFVDAAEMQARLRLLHDVHEISFQRLADRTGIDQTNIKWHYYGRAHRSPDVPLTQCQWRTHNAVMTTVFGPADRKAQVRSIGTQRRLRALVAAGYTQKFIAEATGRTLAHLNHFIVNNSVETSSDHAAAVEQVYRKYADADPAEVGLNPTKVKYSKTVAKKRGFVPGHCWDTDTIDDPDAFPEWTGECGKLTGYYLHLKYDILVSASQHEKESGGKRRRVLCQPCLDVRAREAAKAGISVQAMAHGTDELGIADAVKMNRTYRDIAEQFEVSCRTVQRVANKLRDSGQWTPNTRGNRRKDQ